MISSISEKPLELIRINNNEPADFYSFKGDDDLIHIDRNKIDEIRRFLSEYGEIDDYDNIGFIVFLAIKTIPSFACVLRNSTGNSSDISPVITLLKNIINPDKKESMDRNIKKLKELLKNLEFIRESYVKLHYSELYNGSPEKYDEKKIKELIDKLKQIDENNGDSNLMKVYIAKPRIYMEGLNQGIGKERTHKPKQDLRTEPIKEPINNSLNNHIVNYFILLFNAFLDSKGEKINKDKAKKAFVEILKIIGLITDPLGEDTLYKLYKNRCHSKKDIDDFNPNKDGFYNYIVGRAKRSAWGDKLPKQELKEYEKELKKELKALRELYESVLSCFNGCLIIMNEEWAKQYIKEAFLESEDLRIIFWLLYPTYFILSGITYSYPNKVIKKSRKKSRKWALAKAIVGKANTVSKTRIEIGRAMTEDLKNRGF